METSEYELDDPDELLKLGRERVSDLTLHGDDSNLYVRIGQHGAYVSYWGKDPKVIVLAQNLRSTLLACRKRLHWLLSWWTNVVWFGLEAVGVILVYGVGGTAGKISGNVLMALALVLIVASTVMRFRFGSVIHLRNRRDSQSFL